LSVQLVPKVNKDQLDRQVRLDLLVHKDQQVLQLVKVQLVRWVHKVKEEFKD
jgi:hypothetical protein